MEEAVGGQELAEVLRKQGDNLLSQARYVRKVGGLDGSSDWAVAALTMAAGVLHGGAEKLAQAEVDRLRRRE